MAGNWNFTADSEIQKELANNLNVDANNFDAKVTDMYTQIDTMGSEQAWVGEDYDLFKTGCDGYKGAMKDLSDSFRMYAKHLEKISTGTEELATTLIGMVQNITAIQTVVDLADIETFSDSANLMTEEQTSTNNVWTTYEEASAAGFSNIRTESEFLRGDNEDKRLYGTYENYLLAMYGKYVA